MTPSSGQMWPPVASPGASGPSESKLAYSSNLDTNGLIYYLGTDGLVNAFTNPVDGTRIVGSVSSAFEGSAAGLTDRAATATNHAARWASNDVVGSWVKYDFGAKRKVQLSRYTLRAIQGRNEMPRNWKVQGSNDDIGWQDLITHASDTTIAEGAWGSFAVNPNGFWRYLRIINTGVNAQGAVSGSFPNRLSIDQLEFYGVLAVTP